MIKQYLDGMLEISVEGVNLERFINKANGNGIALYNVVRLSYDHLICTVDFSSFRKIAVINRELRCRIKVKKRYGLKFLLNRVKRRKAFVVGAAIFIVFLVIMSSSIWRIDISGIDKIRAGDVLRVVDQMDSGIGFFKTRCDTKALEIAIRRELNDVDWVIVDIHGVVMSIRIVETVEGDKRQDQTPSSIVSEVDGEILYISTVKGEPEVEVGDNVKAGQTLINGIVDRRPEKDYYYVRYATGEIRARVEYSGSASVEIKSIDKKSFTGNVAYESYIELFGWRLGATGKPEFEHYTSDEICRNVFQVGRLFPIYSVKKTYREYTPLTEREILQRAQDILLGKAVNDACRRIPIGAAKEDQRIEYNYDEESGILYANAKISAIHSIGVRKFLSQEEIDGLGNAKGDINNG